MSMTLLYKLCALSMMKRLTYDHRHWSGNPIWRTAC